MDIVAVLRRAFASDPSVIPVGERESEVLAAQGIQQPALQQYFAWRRGVMVFVVAATLASAGLSTYRDLVETGDRFAVVETIAKHLPMGQHVVLPAIQEAKGMVDEDAEEDAADKDSDPASPAATAEKSTDDAESKPVTAFERFTDIVQLIALYALPVAAVAVVLMWTQFQRSFQIMVAAFVFSFMTPLLIALCPWSWWGYVEPIYSPQAQPVQYFQQMAEGLLEAAAYLVTLLPTVLSLVPGVQRACLRVKMLLPQSILPGWFLVVASPFYALFLLVVFVAINQVDTHPLFFIGMLLFMAAPLSYTVWGGLFARQVSSQEDHRKIRDVQKIVGGMTAVAGILIVIYLATREFMGIRLLGLDTKTALLVPMDLVEFFLETISRSMFVTVLGADLFMRMNLAAWKNAQAFAGSTEAENYDRVMGEFDRTP